jgi:hypothetical protein
MSLLQTKNFIELDNFIDNKLVFNNTLITNGYFTHIIEKKRVFGFIPKNIDTLVKTAKYHEVMGYYLKRIESKENILKILCEDMSLKDKVLEKYWYIVNSIKKAYEDKAKEEEKKKASSSENKDNLFGI